MGGNRTLAVHLANRSNQLHGDRDNWVESWHSPWHPAWMLFTPKKYGKDWTRFLGISFYGASIGFAFFALIAAWTNYDNLADKIFSVVAFILGATVFGALGKDQWTKHPK